MLARVQPMWGGGQGLCIIALLASCNAILGNEEELSEPPQRGSAGESGSEAASSGAAGSAGDSGQGGGGQSGAGGSAGEPSAECMPDEQQPCSAMFPELQGNCANGMAICQSDGTWSDCGVAPESEDSCTLEGDDANCDGTPNGDCDCIEGEVQPCGPETDTGDCQRGESVCEDLKWTECSGATFPEARDCRSAQDNDCDGIADNTLDDVCQCVPGSTELCEEASELDGIGICTASGRQCVVAADTSSSSWSGCTASVEPLQSELCNDDEKDEDCDGEVNESPPCACLNGATRACGECDEGRQTCIDGAWGACAGQLGARVTYYADSDRDTYGSATVTTTSCAAMPPTGYVANHDDCCDSDARVNPAAAFSTTGDAGCGLLWEFNCSPTIEVQYTEEQSYSCCDCFDCYNGTSGWDTYGQPSCGDMRGWYEASGCSCVFAGTRTQGCR
jgi:hypothetical protein